MLGTTICARKKYAIVPEKGYLNHLPGIIAAANLLIIYPVNVYGDKIAYVYVNIV